MLLLEDSSVNPEWDTVENRWTVLRGSERREVSFTLHVYSADELTSILKNGGLDMTGVYGWFDGSPYDDNATRLVAVARRPWPGFDALDPRQ